MSSVRSGPPTISPVTYNVPPIVALLLTVKLLYVIFKMVLPDFAPTRFLSDNTFVPEASLIVEEFTNQVINAKSAWSLTLSNDVEDNNSGLVTLYVNGVKYGAVSSVSSNTVNFNVLGFDIEDSDLLEVHYVKKHSVA